MSIFFNFSRTLNYFHLLQDENCDNNSRLAVDENDNCKFGIERVNNEYSALRVGDFASNAHIIISLYRSDNKLSDNSIHIVIRSPPRPSL